jgi:hypothetical protein
MGNKPIVKSSALAIGLGALLATTAVAATAGAASAGADVQAEPQQTAAKDKSRRICRNLTPSGSRLTRRLCRTQAEWDQNRETTQDSVLKEQLGSGTTYDSPG